MPDHNVPTLRRSLGLAGISDPESRLQVETLERNAAEFGVPAIPLTHRQQGIVHVVIWSSIRHFAKLLTLATLSIGFFIAVFTRTRQTLHGLIAGCVVISKTK